MATKASELPAGTHEEATFDYSSLPLILKLSNWMSWRAVVNNLRTGSWVDLMCGMRAMLQQSQLKNRKITEFTALDQEIDEGLERIGIKTSKQTIVDSLPLESTSYDNVTFINGLEHFFADQDMLHECFRILKPGGVLQVIVPTWFGLAAVLGLPANDSVSAKQRAMSLVINVAGIVVASFVTYAALRMRGESLRAFNKPATRSSE